LRFLSLESEESEFQNPGIGAKPKGQNKNEPLQPTRLVFENSGGFSLFVDGSGLRLPERAGARVGGTQGAYPRIFLQNLGLQVDFQKVGHRHHPGQDIGHFPPHMIFFSAVSPGELSHFLKEPKEGFIRSPFLIPFQVYLPDQVLEFSNFQGFLLRPADIKMIIHYHDLGDKTSLLGRYFS